MVFEVATCFLPTASPKLCQPPTDRIDLRRESPEGPRRAAWRRRGRPRGAHHDPVVELGPHELFDIVNLEAYVASYGSLFQQ